MYLETVCLVVSSASDMDLLKKKAVVIAVANPHKNFKNSSVISFITEQLASLVICLLFRVCNLICFYSFIYLFSHTTHNPFFTILHYIVRIDLLHFNVRTYFYLFKFNSVSLSVYISVWISEGMERHPEDNTNDIFLPLKYQTDLLFTRWVICKDSFWFKS